MRAGEALVKLLQDYGVDIVFGIPGTHSIELYRGLRSSAIRHVLPRHEQGGGFMADGYARVSGKPGVCFVITGAGVTNLATPMAEAFLDAVPMLVVSPVNPPTGASRNLGRLHELSDQAAVTAPFTAFSATVAHADEIPGAIARAFATFAARKPGPVHINVARPVLAETVGDVWQPASPPYPPQPSRSTIEAVADALADARAVIVAGGGARAGSKEIVALAEHVAAPVITTVAGRGVIDARHPLCAGQLRAGAAQSTLAEADVALLFGTEMALTDHYHDALRYPGTVVRINLDIDAAARLPVTVSVMADCTATATALTSALSPASADRRAEAEAASARVREEMPHDDRSQRHLAVLQSLLSSLPDDAIIVSDMTQIAYTGVEWLALPATLQWLHPTGYGTLGYALPAAIGAKLAAPHRKVVALVGDAGLQYTGQEMSVAAELGLDLVMVLWNNDALQQIEDDMNEAGFEPLGVKQRNPDFQQWAQACHWQSAKAADLQAFTGDLNAALRRDDVCTLVQIDDWGR